MTKITPEEIKKTREESGLSQKQAADLLHCTLNAWQKWEYGERQMHAAFWELFKMKIKNKR